MKINSSYQLKLRIHELILKINKILICLNHKHNKVMFNININGTARRNDK